MKVSETGIQALRFSLKICHAHMCLKLEKYEKYERKKRQKRNLPNKLICLAFLLRDMIIKTK